MQIEIFTFRVILCIKYLQISHIDYITHIFIILFLIVPVFVNFVDISGIFLVIFLSNYLRIFPVTILIEGS